MSLRKLIEDFENGITGILKKYKITLTWTFLIMTLTHIYFFVGRFINEDMHGYLFMAPSRPSSGRYFYGTAEFSIIPIVIFIIVSAELAATVILLLEIFKIEDKILGIITAALVVTFPSWSCSFMFAFMWDTYSLALLTAVLAVYLACKWKYGFLLGAFFITCSLSLYQYYITVSITLSLIILLCELCRKDLKEVLQKAFKFLACGVLGFILYKFGIWAFNIELSGYKGISTMGMIPAGRIPELLKRTYESFALYFINADKGEQMRFFYAPVFVSWVYIADMVLAIWLLKSNIIKKIKTVNKIFIVFFLAILPMAVNLVDLVGVETKANNLNTYSFVFIFILPIVLLSRYQTSIWGGGRTLNIRFFTKRILIILSFIIISHNFWLNNAYYLKADYVAENTESFLTRLLSRFEQLEGFTKETKFTVIYDNSKFRGNSISEEITAFNMNRRYASFPNYLDPGFEYRVVGFKGYNEADFRMERLMKNMIGAELKAASDEEREKIMKTDEYKSMGVYPAETSVKMINGIAVVNFIENKTED